MEKSVVRKAVDLGKVDQEVEGFVTAVSTSPLFHAGVIMAVAILGAVEGKWPSTKVTIAGAVALAGSVGRVLGSILDWFKTSAPSAQTK